MLYFGLPMFLVAITVSAQAPGKKPTLRERGAAQAQATRMVQEFRYLGKLVRTIEGSGGGDRKIEGNSVVAFKYEGTFREKFEVCKFPEHLRRDVDKIVRRDFSPVLERGPEIAARGGPAAFKVVLDEALARGGAEQGVSSTAIGEIAKRAWDVTGKPLLKSAGGAVAKGVEVFSPEISSFLVAGAKDIVSPGYPEDVKETLIRESAKAAKIPELAVDNNFDPNNLEQTTKDLLNQRMAMGMRSTPLQEQTDALAARLGELENDRNLESATARAALGRAKDALENLTARHETETEKVLEALKQAQVERQQEKETEARLRREALVNKMNLQTVHDTVDCVSFLFAQSGHPQGREIGQAISMSAQLIEKSIDTFSTIAAAASTAGELATAAALTGGIGAVVVGVLKIAELFGPPQPNYQRMILEAVQNLREDLYKVAEHLDTRLDRIDAALAALAKQQVESFARIENTLQEMMAAAEARHEGILREFDAVHLAFESVEKLLKGRFSREDREKVNRDWSEAASKILGNETPTVAKAITDLLDSKTLGWAPMGEDLSPEGALAHAGAFGEEPLQNSEVFKSTRDLEATDRYFLTYGLRSVGDLRDLDFVNPSVWCVARDCLDRACPNQPHEKLAQCGDDLRSAYREIDLKRVEITRALLEDHSESTQALSKNIETIVDSAGLWLSDKAAHQAKFPLNAEVFNDENKDPVSGVLPLDPVNSHRVQADPLLDQALIVSGPLAGVKQLDPSLYLRLKLGDSESQQILGSTTTRLRGAVIPWSDGLRRLLEEKGTGYPEITARIRAKMAQNQGQDLPQAKQARWVYSVHWLAPEVVYDVYPLAQHEHVFRPGSDGRFDFDFDAFDKVRAIPNEDEALDLLNQPIPQSRETQAERISLKRKKRDIYRFYTSQGLPIPQRFRDGQFIAHGGSSVVRIKLSARPAVRFSLAFENRLFPVLELRSPLEIVGSARWLFMSSEGSESARARAIKMDINNDVPTLPVYGWHESGESSPFRWVEFPSRVEKQEKGAVVWIDGGPQAVWLDDTKSFPYVFSPNPKDYKHHSRGLWDMGGRGFRFLQYVGSHFFRNETQPGGLNGGNGDPIQTFQEFSSAGPVDVSLGNLVGFKRRAQEDFGAEESVIADALDTLLRPLGVLKSNQPLEQDIEVVRFDSLRMDLTPDPSRAGRTVIIRNQLSAEKGTLQRDGVMGDFRMSDWTTPKGRARFLIEELMLYPRTHTGWGDARSTPESRRVTPKLSIDDRAKEDFLVDSANLRNALAEWANEFAGALLAMKQATFLRNLDLQNLKGEVNRVNGTLAAIRGFLWALYKEPEERAELEVYLGELPAGDAHQLFAQRANPKRWTEDPKVAREEILNFVKENPLSALRKVEARR